MLSRPLNLMCQIYSFPIRLATEVGQVLSEWRRTHRVKTHNSTSQIGAFRCTPFQTRTVLLASIGKRVALAGSQTKE